MASRPELKMKLRKYGPLAFLYPVSAALGVGSTLYIAGVINGTSVTQHVTRVVNSSPTTVTVKGTTATAPTPQAQENESIAKLKAKIDNLKIQIEGLTQSQVQATPPSSPNAVGAQASTPTLGTHSTPPSPSAPTTVSHVNAPVIHATTGASSALG